MTNPTYEELLEQNNALYELTMKAEKVLKGYLPEVKRIQGELDSETEDRYALETAINETLDVVRKSAKDKNRTDQDMIHTIWRTEQILGAAIARLKKRETHG